MEQLAEAVARASGAVAAELETLAGRLESDTQLARTQADLRRVSERAAELQQQVRREADARAHRPLRFHSMERFCYGITVGAVLCTVRRVSDSAFLQPE